jgi:hypothetical protein
MAHHRHRQPWRYARLLRFLPHRLRARLHHRLVAADLRPVRGHPPRIGPRRGTWSILLGQDGRQVRPPQNLHGNSPQCVDCNRHHGLHARPGRSDPRLAVPGVLPLLRRLRQCRPDRGGHSARAGIRAGVQTRLGQRIDHRPAAGRQYARCALRCVPRTSHRLAWPVSRRSGPRPARGADPLLGSRITTLAAAPRPHGGSANHSPGPCRWTRSK